MEVLTMKKWLVHYLFGGKKRWTVVEAKSYERASSSIMDEGNVVHILHIEPISDEGISQLSIKDEN